MAAAQELSWIIETIGYTYCSGVHTTSEEHPMHGISCSEETLICVSNNIYR